MVSEMEAMMVTQEEEVETEVFSEEGTIDVSEEQTEVFLEVDAVMATEEKEVDVALIILKPNFLSDLFFN